MKKVDNDSAIISSVLQLLQVSLHDLLHGSPNWLNFSCYLEINRHISQLMAALSFITLSSRFKALVYSTRGLDFIMVHLGSHCVETLKATFTKVHPSSGLPHYILGDVSSHMILRFSFFLCHYTGG